MKESFKASGDDLDLDHTVPIVTGNKKNNKQHKNKYLKHHLNSKAVIFVENLI